MSTNPDDEAVISWLGISMATPCDACSHPANVHEGPPNAVHPCIECTCKGFWLRCQSVCTDYRGTRHECELGRHHLVDHKHGNYRWSTAAAQSQEGAVANPDRTQVNATRDTQVGGNHYKKFKIQPWEIWEEYGLDPWAANALKYLLRAGHKGSKVEDLRKARHYLDYMIEREEEG